MMKSQACRGFTLIEIMVVIAVSAILFSIGFLSFQSYSRQQSLLAVVRSVQTDLRLAEESASAGTKPSACDTFLNGYKFNVTSATSYEIDAYCTTNTIVTKTVTLPSGFTISTPSPNPITFKSLAQGTNVISDINAVIGITQTATSKYLALEISQNGQINQSSAVQQTLPPSTPTIAPTSTPLATATPIPTPPPTWVFCAEEDGTCSFSGTKQVRYGSNPRYAYGTYTNSVGCNNGIFGDPAADVHKHCDVYQ